MIEALNPFCPARAAAGAGGSGGSIIVTWGAGERKVRGNQMEIFGSAYGGGNGQDGTSGTTVHLTNIYVTPIEIVETEFPCRVTRFELIAGSGGDGMYRGGLSFRREYEMLQPGTVMFRGDRTKFPAKGYAGGKDGRPARFVLNPGEAREKVMPSSCRVELAARRPVPRRGGRRRRLRRSGVAQQRGAGAGQGRRLCRRSCCSRLIWQYGWGPGPPANSGELAETTVFG